MADGTLDYQIRLDSAQALAAMERFANVADRAEGEMRQLGSASSAAGASLQTMQGGVGTSTAALNNSARAAQTAQAAQTALAASARAAGAGSAAASMGVTGLAASTSGLMVALGPLLPILAAVSLAVSGLSALAQGIGLANEAERTAIAFKTLTGSAEEARAVVGMLSQMAVDTPFKEAELQGGARALLAARVPAGALKTELSALGNIAAATQGDIGRLATVYGQVAGKGKLYAEERQQFVEQGAGELRQAVAETLGVTTAELMEMMQAGQVGFSTLQTAIQNLAGEGGKWGQAMAEQSRGNLGLLSSLADNVGKILRLLATPISDGPLKTFLQSAVEVSGQVAAALQGAMATGNVGELLKQGLIFGAKEGLNALIDLVASILERIAASLMRTANLVKAALSGSAEAIKELMGSFDPGKMKFDTTEQTDFFKKMGEAGKASADALKPAAEGWEEAMDAITPAGGSSAGSGSGKTGGVPSPEDVFAPLPALPTSAAAAQAALAKLPPELAPLPALPPSAAQARRMLSQPPAGGVTLPPVTNPAAAGAAAQAALSTPPAGRLPGADPLQAGGGSKELLSELKAIKAELTRIRTE